MPYQNQYNQRIANEINAYNDRFATQFAYSPVDGRGHPYQLDGGGTGGVLYQMGNASKRDGEDNIVNDNVAPYLPEVYYLGNDAQGDMNGGNGYAEGTYRDRGDGHSLGVTGKYEKKSGGNFLSDLSDGFKDLGSDVVSGANYVFGSGHHAKHIGEMLKASKEKYGASWWDTVKQVVPSLLLGVGKKPRSKKPKKMKEITGGSILGNPDAYPRIGNNKRMERDSTNDIVEEKYEEVKPKESKPKESKPKAKKKLIRVAKLKGSAELLGSKQDDLLAMPNPVLSNGVPPTAQLRGSYGGSGKPKKAKVEKTLIKLIEKKMKGKGKSKDVSTDSSSSSDSDSDNEKNIKEDKNQVIKTVGGSRSVRAEIVKKIMKEKGLSMINASKYVKEHNLYKKK